MKNLTIGKKLIAGFGIVLVLMLLIGAISALSMNRINEQTHVYSDYTVPNAQLLTDMIIAMEGAKQNTLMAIVSSDAIITEQAIKTASEHGKKFVEALQAYYDNQPNEDRIQDLDYIKSVATNAAGVRATLSEGAQKSLASQIYVRRYMNEYLPLLDNITGILKRFAEEDKALSLAQEQSVQETVTNSWIILIAFLMVAVGASAVVVIVIRRSIVVPVNKIIKVYDEIAKGNMQQEIDYEGKDEIGKMAKIIRASNQMLNVYIQDISDKLAQLARGNMRIKVDIDYIGDFRALKQALEDTASSLNRTLLTISTAAEQVSVGSAQVSSGAHSLAAGSAEQASSVEELNASMTQIADEATKNSMNVEKATEYVEEANYSVLEGTEYMKQLTKSMQDIGHASKQITNITKAIEDIAFQTNILALNAAIEAARAGSAGKGFAVVADEVRNLAAKSAEAAKQTSELISTAVSTVDEGMKVLEKTVAILHTVEERTEHVNEVMGLINEASAQQAAAIEQVKLGLAQVSNIIQTNAAIAEQNSATSEEMSAQAATLKEEVERFELDDGNEVNVVPRISLVANETEDLDEEQGAFDEMFASMEGALGKY